MARTNHVYRDIWGYKIPRSFLDGQVLFYVPEKWGLRFLFHKNWYFKRRLFGKYLIHTLVISRGPSHFNTMFHIMLTMTRTILHRSYLPPPPNTPPPPLPRFRRAKLKYREHSWPGVQSKLKTDATALFSILVSISFCCTDRCYLQHERYCKCAHI